MGPRSAGLGHKEARPNPRRTMESLLRPVDNFTAEVRPVSLEWLVSFKDPRQLLQEHPFALALELGTAILVALAVRSAKRRDPQEAYLLLAAMCSTVCFEILPILPRPGYLLWWYHQGTVNLLRQRLPLYVVCCFSLVHHLAHRLTAGCGLPRWGRAGATALAALLVAWPALALAPRLLLVLFHADDPVFASRLPGGVPAVQALVLGLLLFHTSHLFQAGLDDLPAADRSPVNMLKCSVQTGLVSGIYALVEQYLLYLLFSLILNAHTGLCLLAFFGVLFFFAKEEMQALQFRGVSFAGVFGLLRRPAWWALVATFAVFVSLPLWLDVGALRSTGDRLELGPCHVRQSVANTSPLEFERRRYICPEDVGRLPFDFRCVDPAELQSAVRRRAARYTACGLPLEDPARLARATAAYALPCLAALSLLAACSFRFAREQVAQGNCKKAN